MKYLLIRSMEEFSGAWAKDGETLHIRSIFLSADLNDLSENVFCDNKMVTIDRKSVV